MNFLTNKELIELLEKHPLDAPVYVHAFGGIGGLSAAVTKVSTGFDWDNGKIVLHTSRALTYYQPLKTK